MTTLPADPIAPEPNATEVERQYAMLLGGLANVVNRVALDAGLAGPDIASILAVVEDFSDGRIDGEIAGMPVMLNGVPIGVFSINEEIARFRNNNFAAYSGTALLVVDEDAFSRIPPVAADDDFQVNRGDTLSVPAPGVLGNDVGDALAATLETAPANSIAFALQADGSFSYQHDGGMPGDVTFEYSATDGSDVSNVATVTIEVVNRIPVAGDDSATVAEGGAVDIMVTANDSDGDGDPLTVTLVDMPANGLPVVAPGGTVTYTHDGGQTTNDSFTYVVNDGFDDSAPATVSITVTPVNDAPVAADDAYQMNRSDVLGIGAPGALLNDSDADGDPLTATLETPPGNSIAFDLRPDGSFSYQHDGGPPGDVTFGYFASDGLADSNVATVTISVVNVPPVADNDAATTTRGGTTTLLDSGDASVLSNDTDANGDTLAVRLGAPPLNAADFSFNADGTFSYTHDGSATTNDSFTYIANDGFDDSNAATVNIEVVNTPPVANGDMARTGSGGTTTMLDSGDASVLSNDTDADGDALTARLGDPPSNAADFSFNADGTFSYTHDGSQTTSDSFTYFANDGLDDSDPATVDIVVNALPVAAADCIVVAEGASVSVVNGVCPAPRPRASRSAGAPARMPRPTRGPAFFTGTSGTVQLLVDPPPSVEPFAFQNDAMLPVFVEQPQFGLSRPAVVNLTEPDVYGPGGNDGNNAGACLPVNSFIGSALIHGDSTQGFPTWNGGLTLNQPLIGLITDSLDLATSDSLMGSPSVVYPPGPDPTRGLDLAAPPGIGDSLTIEPDRLALSGIDFLLDFGGDPQLDVARIVVSPPLLPQVSLIGNLSAVMTAEPRQIDKDPMPPVVVAPEGRPLRIVDRRRAVVSLVPPGADTFIIDFQMLGSDEPLVPGQPVQLVQDGPLLSVSVTEPGDYEFVLSVPELTLVVNGPLETSLLNNDSDPDRDPLMFTEITAQPASGTVSIEPDGTFVYTHDGSESTTDSFGYRISDGTDTDDGVVTVTVLPVDDPPVAADDVMLPIDEGGNVSMLVGGAVSVLANDFDAEADNNTAQLLDPPANAGMFALNNDGTFFYEHDGSPTTSDEFIYVVESAFTGSCVARVAVAINPVNDPPTTSGIADVVDAVSAGGTIIDLFAAFDDEEDPDDALLFEVVDNTNPGIFVAVNVLGEELELLYEAPGSATLTIRATDTGGLFVETSFAVTLQSGPPVVLNLTGVVTSATGGFSTLTPPGTPVGGPLDVNNVSLVGPGDINSIEVNVGGFCFSTETPSACPVGGADVPITSIDAAALDLSSPPGVGGTLSITAFSPTFQVSIPVSFDFDAGTFVADGGALGTIEGDVDLQAVPVPAVLEE